MKTKLTLKPRSISTSFGFAKSHLHFILVVKPKFVSVVESKPIIIKQRITFSIPLGFRLPHFSWQIIAPTIRIGAVFDEEDWAYGLFNPRFFPSPLKSKFQFNQVFVNRPEVISSGV